MRLPALCFYASVLSAITTLAGGCGSPSDASRVGADGGSDWAAEAPDGASSGGNDEASSGGDGDGSASADDGGLRDAMVDASTDDGATKPSDDDAGGASADGAPPADAAADAGLADAGLVDAGPCGATACTGTPIVARRQGEGVGQSGHAIAFDSAGNVIITGTSDGGTFAFGGEPAQTYRAFVAKFSGATHQLLWVRHLGYAYPADVALDALDNIFVTGAFTASFDFGGGPMTPKSKADGFLLELSSDNTHLYSAQFGLAGGVADSVYPLDMAVSASGEVVLGGRLTGSADFGGGVVTPPNGKLGGFVVKFAANHTHVFGRVLEDGHPCVGIDGAGTVIFGQGTFGDQPSALTRVTATGAPMFEVPVAGGKAPRVKCATGGGAIYALAGVESRFSPVTIDGKSYSVRGLNDVFLARHDPATGAPSWVRQLGKSGARIHPTEMAVDTRGNPVATGSFVGGQVNLGGADIANNGGTHAGAYVTFLLKHDGQGRHLWSRIGKGFGTYDESGADDVAAGPAGQVGFIGRFKYAIDLGTGRLDTAGQDDLFWAVYAP